MRIGRMCVCTCTSRVTSEFFLDSRTRSQQCSWSRGSQEAVISFLFLFPVVSAPGTNRAWSKARSARGRCSHVGEKSWPRLTWRQWQITQLCCCEVGHGQTMTGLRSQGERKDGVWWEGEWRVPRSLLGCAGSLLGWALRPQHYMPRWDH